MGADTRPGHVGPHRLAALAELLRTLPAATPGGAPGDVRLLGDPSVEITGISLSTDRIAPGDLYAALPGTRVHGADFAAAAVASGAVAVLTDPAGHARLVAHPDEHPEVQVSGQVPVIVVPSPRAVLGRLSAHVYGEPATALTMLAVTGTQGKTTTTRLLERALESAGVRAAAIGTVGTRILGEEVATSLTTPEAPDLQALLALMAERRVTACAMEVSSHALVLGRVDGIRFDVSAFLNLGRDHLDFHTDVEDYYRAKAALFTPARTRKAVINIDDEHGRRLAGEAAALGVEVRTCALDSAADWNATDIVQGTAGSNFVLVGPEGLRVTARVPLPGRFNVSNALVALAVAGEAGLPVAEIAAHLAAGGGVPGRMEQVVAGQDFEIVVDYAHKPDAVEAALATLRPLTDGQLIVVLGAGGDRDPGKRALMGEIAARLADVLVVTDDNPRSEDPASIRAAVLSDTASGRAEVLEQGDRRLAIRTAVSRARTGDIVLIAGKGHETGQEARGHVEPFDDRVVAREEVAAR